MPFKEIQGSRTFHPEGFEVVHLQNEFGIVHHVTAHVLGMEISETVCPHCHQAMPELRSNDIDQLLGQHTSILDDLHNKIVAQAIARGHEVRECAGCKLSFFHHPSHGEQSKCRKCR